MIQNKITNVSEVIANLKYCIERMCTIDERLKTRIDDTIERGETRYRGLLERSVDLRIEVHMLCD